jgi:hypothetical protein
MLAKTLTAAGLSLCFILPAMAQPAKPSDSTAATTESQPTTLSIRQDIMQDLQKAGYKNIHLAPASFVAHATDQHGNPVVMAISPDSVTMITAMNPPAQAGSTKTASAAPSTGGANSK